MLCLLDKPSKLDHTKYPGAKSRYDDFVAVHMNQTLYIHGTVGRCCSLLLASKSHLLTSYSMAGQLLVMAPILYMGIRICSEE